MLCGRNAEIKKEKKINGKSLALWWQNYDDNRRNFIGDNECGIRKSEKINE